MKITKLTVNGKKQAFADDSDSNYPLLKLKTRVLVSDAARGDAEKATVDIADNDICELVFADNTTWLGSPDTIEELYPGVVKIDRDGEAGVELPSTLQHPDASRGIIGEIALKVFNLFERRVVKKGMRDLAVDLEGKQMAGFKGLIRIKDNFNLENILPGELTTKEGPALLFIHGTNSSTFGSFGELPGTTLWKYVTRTYGKNNVLGFQHETLTKSPLENAADLVDQLPAGIELHIITHSRGGLVGEILS